MSRIYHIDGTSPAPTPDTIFVFGSNLDGRHGGGAALAAFRYWGAEAGIGIGRRGASYAIPTKDELIETLPLGEISKRVADFLVFARSNADKFFFVTRIGCGLAGYADADIAPMFRGAPGNCSFAEEWRLYLDAAS